MSKRKCYTDLEKADIAAAEKELARPDITLAERERANRVLNRCALAAKKRAEGRPQPLAAEYAAKEALKPQPDAEGWMPTPAQQFVLDHPKDAVDWRWVFKMEAAHGIYGYQPSPALLTWLAAEPIDRPETDILVDRALARGGHTSTAPGCPESLCGFCHKMGQLAGARSTGDGSGNSLPICTVCAQPFILAAQEPVSCALEAVTAPNGNGEVL